MFRTGTRTRLLLPTPGMLDFRSAAIESPAKTINSLARRLGQEMRIRYYLKRFEAVPWFKEWLSGTEPRDGVSVLTVGELQRCRTAFDYVAFLQQIGVTSGDVAYGHWFKSFPATDRVAFIEWQYGGPEPSKWLVLRPSDVRQDKTFLRAQISLNTQGNWKADPGRWAALQEAIQAARETLERKERILRPPQTKAWTAHFERPYSEKAPINGQMAARQKSQDAMLRYAWAHLHPPLAKSRIERARNLGCFDELLVFLDSHLTANKMGIICPGLYVA